MNESMSTLRLTNAIDHDFVAIVQRVLNNTLRLYRPRHVRLVRIDNWFDHKWLGFGTYIKEGDPTPLKLPLFERSRVLSQLDFGASADAPTRYEPAGSNPYRHRRGGGSSISAAFLWYSRVCEKSDRGSLMVYLNEEGKRSEWYASLRKNPDWRVAKVKGISQREFSDCYQALQTDPADYGFNINS